MLLLYAMKHNAVKTHGAEGGRGGRCRYSFVHSEPQQQLEVCGQLRTQADKKYKARHDRSVVAADRQEKYAHFFGVSSSK
jgi:hypothetical protein